MSPEIKQFSSFAVQGFQVRTTNAAEQTAEAKIGALWGRYFSSPGAGASAVYGVYSGYESDWTGAFDVTAGSEVEVGVAGGAAPKADQTTVQIQSGKYLVFHTKGAMSQAVLEAWGRVWQYFAAPRTDWRRCYATDFEQYLGADEVEVCIGVKPV